MKIGSRSLELSSTQNRVYVLIVRTAPAPVPAIHVQTTSPVVSLQVRSPNDAASVLEAVHHCPGKIAGFHPHLVQLSTPEIDGKVEGTTV
jgi:hypothetical protein